MHTPAPVFVVPLDPKAVLSRCRGATRFRGRLSIATIEREILHYLRICYLGVAPWRAEVTIGEVK
jgi:hypothetical protein